MSGRLWLLCVLAVFASAAVSASAQFVLPNLGGGGFQRGGGFHHGVVTGLESDMDAMPQSWPQVVGMDATEAKAAIEADAPGKTVYLVPKGSMVTMDFRMDRVRVFYNPDNNLVMDVPRVG